MFSQSSELKEYDVFMTMTDKISVAASSPEDAINVVKAQLNISPRAVVSFNVAVEQSIEEE